MKLLCAQAQGMYWFLVMRTDLGARRGDVACVVGRRIGAAPFVELGLHRLLTEVGIDPVRDVGIAPIPGSLALKVNTGVTAAQALADGVIDGFWANGMGVRLPCGAAWAPSSSMYVAATVPNQPSTTRLRPLAASTG
jgi:hypothetical protein